MTESRGVSQSNGSNILGLQSTAKSKYCVDVLRTLMQFVPVKAFPRVCSQLTEKHRVAVLADMLVHIATVRSDALKYPGLSLAGMWLDVGMGSRNALIQILTKDPQIEVCEQALPRLPHSKRLNEAFVWAARKGKLNHLKLMRNANPSFNKNQAIGEASFNGHAPVVRYLLGDKRVDPKVDESSAIRSASEQGHLNVVKLLLTDGRSDPNAMDSHALHLAARNGHSKIVKLLLSDKRVEPNSVRFPAVVEAAFRGHTRAIEELLSDTRVDPTVQNNKALQLAAKSNKVDVVRLLLRHPKISSLPNSEALEQAAWHGHTEVVRVLVNHRATRLPFETINSFVFLATFEMKKLLRQLMERQKKRD